ncbi:MAG: ankyrin repeat domain-containing protein, partial [Planctomycetota bacterium]
KGAKVNIVDNSEKWTALMFAAAEGQVANVKLLLDNSAEVKPKDIDGDTAANFAANNGHTQVAKMIEEHAKTMEIKSRN